MPRAALLVSVASVLLAIPLAHPASAAPEECPVPVFYPGTLVRAGQDEFVAARFRLDAPIELRYWAAMSVPPVTASGFVTPLAAERQVLAAFLENAAGALVAPPALTVVGAQGGQAEIGGDTARATALDGSCGGASFAGMRVTLAPGEHRVVAIGAAEARGRIAALVPPGATLLDVVRGPSVRLTEAAYACEASARASVAGASVEALAGCATTYHAASRAYRALAVGRAPDDDHRVAWIAPDLARIDVDRRDVARGAPGAWTLDIPRYVTAASQGAVNLAPVPARDDGVFGVFADVP